MLDSGPGAPAGAVRCVLSSRRRWNGAGWSYPTTSYPTTSYPTTSYPTTSYPTTSSPPSTPMTFPVIQ